jgi:transketolase
MPLRDLEGKWRAFGWYASLRDLVGLSRRDFRAGYYIAVTSTNVSALYDAFESAKPAKGVRTIIIAATIKVKASPLWRAGPLHGKAIPDADLETATQRNSRYNVNGKSNQRMYTAPYLRSLLK